MKLSVNLFMTLDGVSQAPGGPDEDTRGGFEHGGWLMQVFDDGCGQATSGWYDHCGALLLGRHTYDTFASHWPRVTDPDDAVAAHINNDHKYVVTSRPLGDVWQDTSTALGEDFLAEIEELKKRDSDLELQVHGSIQLARTLHEAGLVDVYRFLVAPLVVGGGAGIFSGENAPALLMNVTNGTVTENGVFSVEMTPSQFTKTLSAAIVDGKDTVVEVPDDGDR